MRSPSWLLIGLWGVSLLASGAMAKERRAALVIGNGAYEAGGVLPNAPNDAKLMAKVLKEVGFEVSLHLDLSHRDMVAQITKFETSLAKTDVGLFYYAGHAAEVKGQNYLIPVDKPDIRPSQVEFDTVNVGRVVSAMEVSNNPVNIMILDSCRNNPFRGFSRSASQGLAQITTGAKGMYIAYSTAPGTTAEDGEGENSTYTSALARFMSEPGRSIHDIFSEVTAEVIAKTGGDQIPWSSSSLVGRFSFVAPQPESEAVGAGAEAALREKLEQLRAENEQIKAQAQEREKREKQARLEQEKARKEREKQEVARKDAERQEQERLELQSQQRAKQEAKRREQERIELAMLEKKREEEKRAERLEKKLGTCTRYRLSEAMNQAHNCYKGVLGEAPGNKTAIAGIDKIASYYEKKLEKALRKKQLKQAEDTLALLRGVDSSLANRYRNKVEKLGKKKAKKIRVIPSF